MPAPPRGEAPGARPPAGAVPLGAGATSLVTTVNGSVFVDSKMLSRSRLASRLPRGDYGCGHPAPKNLEELKLMDFKEDLKCGFYRYCRCSASLLCLAPSFRSLAQVGTHWRHVLPVLLAAPSFRTQRAAPHSCTHAWFVAHSGEIRNPHKALEESSDEEDDADLENVLQAERDRVEAEERDRLHRQR